MANTVIDSTAHMPSDVSSRLSFFDRFAGGASRFFSRASFFAFCVLLVLVWAPSYFVIGSLDTWQLIINTATTIVTFLMVALLQNSQTRSDSAVQDKLNAVAAALAQLMEAHSGDSEQLRDATRELREAVGLEDRESS
ncbi:MAG TPA: low affinity iron permease family protein [Kribbella sp.]